MRYLVILDVVLHDQKKTKHLSQILKQLNSSLANYLDFQNDNHFIPTSFFEDSQDIMY